MALAGALLAPPRSRRGSRQATLAAADRLLLRAPAPAAPDAAGVGRPDPRALGRRHGEAILALDRSADPGVLEAAGEGLGGIPCPAPGRLGGHDPYIGALDGGRSRAGSRRPLPSSRQRAGHWPWIDEPDLVAAICGLLQPPQVGGRRSGSGLTIFALVSRPLSAIGRRLPRGWSDLLLQFALFFGAYQGYQLVRGFSRAGALPPSPTPSGRRSRALARAPSSRATSSRRRCSSLGHRRRQLDVRQLPLHHHRPASSPGSTCSGTSTSTSSATCSWSRCCSP